MKTYYYHPYSSLGILITDEQSAQAVSPAEAVIRAVQDNARLIRVSPITGSVPLDLEGLSSLTQLYFHH